MYGLDKNQKIQIFCSLGISFFVGQVSGCMIRDYQMRKMLAEITNDLRNRGM